MDTTDFIIIVAGGRGVRMGSDIPKQFLPIGGKPVLMRTIERFYNFSKQLGIILVLPDSQRDYWLQLCEKHGFSIPVTIVSGGDTRFHSVCNGLKAIADDAKGVVGIHDGVRPFPSTDVIERCYETAARSGTAVPVVPVVETLRHIDKGTVPREEYRIVQTPQTFDIHLLKKAYKQEYSTTFTDDASVVEAFGHRIILIDGNRENIKITTPFDMQVAELMIKQKATD
ncbi:MAG: 2-C-methyl-D-erythritol 4-phosphate cytidylyltransferase [Prevotella sp.]